VQRAVQYERLGELGVGMTMVHLQERLRFMDPATGDTVVWRQPRQIAVFVDRIDGRFWIVGRNTRLTKNDMRVFQAYLYDGSGWIATEPEQAPPVSRPNLAIDAVVHDRSKHWKFLTLQNKHDLDATSGVDAVYRSIDLRRTL